MVDQRGYEIIKDAEGRTIIKDAFGNQIGRSQFKEIKQSIGSFFSQDNIDVHEAFKGMGLGKKMLVRQVKDILEENKDKPFKVGPMALRNFFQHEFIEPHNTSEDAERLWKSKAVERLFKKHGLEKKQVEEYGRIFNYYEHTPKTIAIDALAKTKKVAFPNVMQEAKAVKSSSSFAETAKISMEATGNIAKRSIVRSEAGIGALISALKGTRI